MSDIPSLPNPCLIANPDISGVGIRLAIYLEAFLNVACATIFCPDASISNFEHAILAASSRNLFLTGCALLICAFYQGSMQGLTVHHTLIILNLNWIIYLSALLYVFIRACKLVFAFRRSRTPRPRASLGEEGTRHGSQSLERMTDADDLRSVWQFLFLPAAHLSALGFLGILLWTQVETFGNQPQCTPRTVLTLFGSSYSVLDRTVRSGSMAVYWIVAIPVLNVAATGFAAFTAVAVMAFVLCGVERIANMKFLSWNAFALYGGIVTISMHLVLFIANNELMIARGVHTSLVGLGEEEWTFGQMLALVIFFVHAGELIKMLCFWKARESRRGRSPIQVELRD